MKKFWKSICDWFIYVEEEQQKDIFPLKCGKVHRDIDTFRQIKPKTNFNPQKYVGDEWVIEVCDETNDIVKKYNNTLNFKDSKTKLTIKDGIVTMPLNYFLELTANDRRRSTTI